MTHIFKTTEDKTYLDVVTVKISKKKFLSRHLPTGTELTFVGTGDILRNKEKGLKMMLKLLKRKKI